MVHLNNFYLLRHIHTRSYLHETNISPIISFLNCRPHINDLYFHLTTQIQTCFGIYSTIFICPQWLPKFITGIIPTKLLIYIIEQLWNKNVKGYYMLNFNCASLMGGLLRNIIRILCDRLCQLLRIMSRLTFI